MSEPEKKRLQRSNLRSRLDRELLEVMSLDTAERASYLAQLAVTEPDLSERLRRMIDEASDLPSSFLAVPAADALRDAGTREARPAASSKKPNSSANFSSPKDRYRVEKLLGSGGMAKVYLARDLQLGRRVALKLLDQSDSAMRRRFQREARSQARIDHANVLEIYETGEIDGRPYISMRYVEGCTLLEAVDELTVEEKIDIFCQVCEGLHAAHETGLLHRDVKPSNVLVEETPDGFKPYVADFGIAVAEEPESTLTTAMAGTPAFIAPERLTDGETDRRSDLYSLGVTMYQVFTGELPFAGESMVEVMRKTCSEEPKPPRAIRSDLPKQIEEVILKCMAKKPDQRFASARHTARALRGEVGDETAAATIETVRLARVEVQPRSLLIGLAAAVLSVLILSVLLWNAYQEKRSAQEELAATQIVQTRLLELFEIPPGVVFEQFNARDMLYRAAQRMRNIEDPVLRGRLLAEVGRRYRRLELRAEAKTNLDEGYALLRAELGEKHPETMRLRAELDAMR